MVISPEITEDRQFEIPVWARVSAFTQPTHSSETLNIGYWTHSASGVMLSVEPRVD